MDDIKIQIPFVLNSKAGIAEVTYAANKSASTSGFDLLKWLDFDIGMCIGYPTMHAYIKDFSGSGYYAGSAWIQIITDKFYSSLEDTIPDQTLSGADIGDDMRKLGVPFFAMGYPAEIYDAPCNNLGKFARLEWIADTFLVTLPKRRINNEIISCLLGFRWGYEESDIEGKRHVKILPIEVLDDATWNKHLPMLRESFPCYKFE